MNFAIIRTAKLKSFGAVIGSARHTFREIPTPNADKERTHLNKTEGAQSSLALARAVKAKLPEKRRKDAVICIEYLITASPEWWKKTPASRQNGFLQASIDWLKTRHGAENVVCLNVQLDETSPHLVAYVVPLTKDGRLSARDFLGGPAKMTAMQTEFAKVVGSRFGLQRGLQGSKAIHTTASQFNAALQKKPILATPKPPIPTIADRITGKAKAQQQKYEVDWKRHVGRVEQLWNVAMVGRHSRARQAEAIERLRKEAEEGKQHEFEVSRLRKEKARLERIIREQQTYFQQQIADLKSALSKAAEQVKKLFAKVALLTLQRDQAESRANELQNRLRPSEHRAIRFKSRLDQ